MWQFYHLNFELFKFLCSVCKIYYFLTIELLHVYYIAQTGKFFKNYLQFLQPVITLLNASSY